MRFTLSLAVVAALALVLVPSSFPVYAAPIKDNAVFTRPVAFNGHQVIRVPIITESDLILLKTNEQVLHFDYFTHNLRVGSNVDIRLDPTSLEGFKKLNIKYTVLIENLQTVLDQESNEIQAFQNSIDTTFSTNDVTTLATDPTWFNGYHTYAQHNTWLAAQISANPTKASAFSAGKTYQNRDQSGIKIGNGPNNVVLHGTQHAREWITTMVVEYFIDQLLSGVDTRVAGYLSKYTFHIIPIMNPDGFVITQTSNRMHRKNAQPNSGGSSCLGTDTNRNWGYKWNQGGSSSNPCDETYMGPKAFSSPEATNVANYIQSVGNVVSYIDFHSYSQLWMVPYGYTNTLPPTYSYMNNLAVKAAAALKAKYGKVFTTGDLYDTVYPASGNSIDYAYNIGVKAPFGVELRDTGTYGFSLPANQILPSGIETWAAFTAILDNM